MKYILQKIGDLIVHQILTCDDKHIESWYKLGEKLERIALYFWVELE